MASLDLETKSIWTEALHHQKSNWILFGLAADLIPISERLNGMAGLIDWHLHGQVSRLIAKKTSDNFFMIPSSNKKPNFLLYHYSDSPDLKKLAEKLKGLQIRELTIAISTFPEDFSKKLKQHLDRDKIQWTKLEPDPK